MRMRVFGSDSPEPGKGLHADWLNWLWQWEEYGAPRELAQDRIAIPLAPNDQAKYIQLAVEAASGPWAKAFEITPNVAEVRTDRSQSSDYVLELGDKAHAAFWLPDGTRVYRELSPENLAGRQTRVFARLKTGERKLLKITSYMRYGADPQLHPSYNFDRNPGIPLGPSNYIPLVEVDAFEIETRKISKGFIVFSLPKPRK
jgi:hypothetical protein